MTPGNLVQLVEHDDRDGIWVGLPGGVSEWITPPYLPAVYVGPTTCGHWRTTSWRRCSDNEEILYSGRLLIVAPQNLEEVRS